MNFIHLELTSRCNKGDGTPGSGCFMCGRRKMEREYPDLCDWGDMPFEMVEQIAAQVSFDTLIQFHNNGEPLLYPRLGDALRLFSDQIKQFNTNGKLLMEKADEIIGVLDVLTVSIIPNDPEWWEQWDIVSQFVCEKSDRKPAMVYRILDAPVEWTQNVTHAMRWDELPGTTCHRILHSPDGSRDYEKPVTVPEIGICLDLLNHLAIDRKGYVSMCVRFDPKGDLKLGNLDFMSLNDCWNSPKRLAWIDIHLKQRRDLLPGCRDCEYWGVPTG